jgi:hypothetical protein
MTARQSSYCGKYLSAESRGAASRCGAGKATAHKSNEGADAACTQPRRSLFDLVFLWIFSHLCQNQRKMQQIRSRSDLILVVNAGQLTGTGGDYRKLEIVGGHVTIFEVTIFKRPFP